MCFYARDDSIYNIPLLSHHEDTRMYYMQVVHKYYSVHVLVISLIWKSHTGCIFSQGSMTDLQQEQVPIVVYVYKGSTVFDATDKCEGNKFMTKLALSILFHVHADGDKPVLTFNMLEEIIITVLET